MKPGTFDPDSRRARIIKWLTDHPGMHRCVTIAQGLGEDTHKVAVACRDLMEQERVSRATIPAANGGRGFTVYGLPLSNKRRRRRATTDA